MLKGAHISMAHAKRSAIWAFTVHFNGPYVRASGLNQLIRATYGPFKGFWHAPAAGDLFYWGLGILRLRKRIE